MDINTWELSIRGLTTMADHISTQLKMVDFVETITGQHQSQLNMPRNTCVALNSCI